MLPEKTPAPHTQHHLRILRENLRHSRREQHLSRKKLASFSPHPSAPSMQRIVLELENGRGNPKLETVCNLARGLNQTTLELFTSRDTIRDTIATLVERYAVTLDMCPASSVRKENYPSPNDSIGLNILRHRKRLLYTQEDIAIMLGKTHVACVFWESGKNHPSAADACSLADIFGITILELATPPEKLREEIALLALKYGLFGSSE